MKKILAALALLALVCGGVFAQELSISGTIELDASAFKVQSVKTSDKEQAYGNEVNPREWELPAGSTLTAGSNQTDPQATWSMFDIGDTDWSSTIITFKVAADNYGGTFEVGAPNLGGGKGNDTGWIRKVEVWMQPASFLRINAANMDGRSAWRAVNRLLGAASMSELTADIPPVPYQGTSVVSGVRIDDFANGVKLDFLLDALVEGLKIEALVGTNIPLWQYGEVKWIGSEEVVGGASYSVYLPAASPGTYTAQTIWSELYANGLPSRITPVTYTLPDINYTQLDASGGTVTLKSISLVYNPQMGYTDAEVYGRYTMGYGARVTFPLADIANFYAIYRLTTQSYTAPTSAKKLGERTELGSNVTYDADEVKGFDVGKNHLALFADLSPLFGAMDLPLSLVLGYTGYFEAGWKVMDKKEIEQTLSGNVKNYYTEWTDGLAPFVSGIDLRVSYKLNDAFGISLHNNATFYTVKYDKDKVGGYDPLLQAYYDHVGFNKYANFTGRANTGKGMSYAEQLQENYTYFRMFNQLGAQYQLIPDFFALNLQLSNEYQSYGTTAYLDKVDKAAYEFAASASHLGSGSSDLPGYYTELADYKYKKGDPLYMNTFSALLNGILTISPKAELDIGLKLKIATDATKRSNKELVLVGVDPLVDETEQNKESNKVYKTTTTTFSVPVVLIVKF